MKNNYEICNPNMSNISWHELCHVTPDTVCGYINIASYVELEPIYWVISELDVVDSSITVIEVNSALEIKIS